MAITYKIRINDFHTDPEKSKTFDLDVDYPTLEDAVNAGWAITEAFASIHDLGCENQGDQFMAYYTQGDKEGCGALTIEIYDSEGKRCEDL